MPSKRGDGTQIFTTIVCRFCDSLKPYAGAKTVPGANKTIRWICAECLKRKPNDSPT